MHTVPGQKYSSIHNDSLKKYLVGLTFKCNVSKDLLSTDLNYP